MQFHTVPHYY